MVKNSRDWHVVAKNNNFVYVIIQNKIDLIGIKVYFVQIINAWAVVFKDFRNSTN